MKPTKVFLLIGLLFLSLSVKANNGLRSPDGIWAREQNQPMNTTLSKSPSTHPSNRFLENTLFSANIDLLKQSLSQAPGLQKKKLGQSGALLSLPLSDGSFISVDAYQYSMMAPKLEQNFPDIKTYKVFHPETQKLLGHIDLTPRGFHGMIQSEDGVIYIDPLRSTSNTTKNNITHQYRSFKLKNQSIHQCTLLKENETGQTLTNTHQTLARQNGNVLKKYRIAVMTTGEYAAAVSLDPENPSISDAQAAIVTAINRINQIYTRDFAIQLDLVANNHNLIFLDGSNDPFNGNADHDINIITEEINKIISSEDYDLGHLFTVNGGGLAFFRSVCNNNIKGGALTGVNEIELESDAFYIDYVAHELGHQFGANHTFNGVTVTCGGNRNASTAYEPGSGSTIMAYAGICGAQNLQLSVDSYFHAGTIQEVLDFVESGNGSCFYESTVTGDNLPTVDAGSNYQIPARTPFMLTANANDIDGSEILYTWEQMDTGAASSSLIEMNTDDGTRPLFRSFFGSSSPTRFFPKFEQVLAQNIESTPGETLPTTNRILNFRITVRSDESGMDSDNQKVFINAAAGAFNVLEPQQDTYHFESDTMTVLWDVAGTTEEPVSCSYVDILLATDTSAGFDSFKELSSNLENNGNAMITLPAGLSSTARILVRCSNNIFYNVNEGNFNIVDSSNTLISIHSNTPELKEGNEGYKSFVFIISRSGDISSTSTVEFSISGFGENPANDEDFSNNQIMRGVIHFANNETDKNLEVYIKGDTNFERDEWFVVTLSNTTGGLIATKSAYAIILNDDKEEELLEGNPEGSKKKNGGSLNIIFISVLLLSGFINTLYRHNKYLPVLVLCIAISNCSQQQVTESSDSIKKTKVESLLQTDNLHPQIQSLLWLNTAEADADFKKDLQNSVPKYWAYYSRQGIQLPGLNSEQSASVSEEQYQFQDGMGDVVFSEAHLELRKKFLIYAASYNLLLYQNLHNEKN